MSAAALGIMAGGWIAGSTLDSLATTDGDTATAESVTATGHPAGLSRKQAFNSPVLLELPTEYVRRLWTKV